MICKRCKEELPEDAFSPRRMRCKDCVKAVKREWTERNREHVLQQKRDWHEAHKDEVNRIRSERYHADPEPARERRRAVYYADPAAAIEASRAWSVENRSHRSNYMRGYRAALRGIPSEPYTTEQVYAKTDGACGICGTALLLADYGRDGWHVDHIIPLSAGVEGGCTDTLSNVQAACRTCNLRKGATLPSPMEAS